jgi:hypothetical protein
MPRVSIAMTGVILSMIAAVFIVLGVFVPPSPP